MSGFYYIQQNSPINNPADMPRYQKKILINKQVQDNLRILDCMLRTMSTAENLCNTKYKDKKYNIDKKDVFSFKNHEQIKDDFLMNIQCLNSMINIFKKRHNSKKPEVFAPYDKKKLKSDLDNYRKKVVLKEPGLDKYFKDFANLIDGNNCMIYSNNEMLSSFKKEEQIDEEKINNTAKTIIVQSEKERKKMEKVVEKFNMTGQANLEDEEDGNESMDLDDQENVKNYL